MAISDEDWLYEKLMSEVGQPMRWFWLSFLGTDRFLGVNVVKSCGPYHAVIYTKDLKINPGGEVAIMPYSPDITEATDTLLAEYSNRLLSREEAEELNVKIATCNDPT